MSHNGIIRIVNTKTVTILGTLTRVTNNTVFGIDSEQDQPNVSVFSIEKLDLIAPHITSLIFTFSCPGFNESTVKISRI